MNQKTDQQSRSIRILTLMEEAGYPVGSLYLAERMEESSATIGRILSELERKGLICKVGVRGRVLTDKGRRFKEESQQLSLLQESANDLIATDKLGSDDTASRSMLLDIMNLRLLLEPYAAAQTCLTVSEEQVRRLEQAVLEYKLQIAQGTDGDEPGMRMHLMLAEFSGNTVLKSLCYVLLAQTHAHNIFSRAVDKAKVLDQQAAEHEAIVQAVKQRDGELAASLMRQHITFSLNYLKQLDE